MPWKGSFCPIIGWFWEKPCKIAFFAWHYHITPPTIYLVKIGLIRERKSPPDKRVAFLPAQCAFIQELYPEIEVVVEPSPHRCVSDDQYKQMGITVSENLGDCLVLFGIKEVPPSDLMEGKTYFMFSHTIKQQPHNRKLLQEALQKKICLVDYECITDEHHHRTVAFGRFAGIVGAYNAIRMWLMRHHNISLKPAFQCRDMDEMMASAREVLPLLMGAKMVITGSGRVGQGAMEVLRQLGIKELTATEFLIYGQEEPVFAVVSSRHYIKSKTVGIFQEQDFRKHPEEYESNFRPFFSRANVLLACAYWDPRAPILFSREEATDPDFQIQIISDVTCDMDGSIPTTVRASSISEPFYDLDPELWLEKPPFSSSQNITVCAVDNLPTELPYDASKSFGEMLIKHIIPELVLGGGRVIENATITKEGRLMPAFQYLENYAYEGA